MIKRGVASDDAAWDNLLAEGIDLHVASPSSGQIVINQTDGKTVVNEQGETVDQYTIACSEHTAEAGKAVCVNVSAARTTQEEEDSAPAGDSMLISTDGVNFSRYLTLTMTDTTEQTIYVKAMDDARSEGERVYAISHSVQSEDETFNHVAVKNVKVTVLDNDKPEVVVTGTGHRDTVLEGDGTTQITDTYEVQLSKAVAFGETVEVLLSNDGQLALSSADVRYNAGTNTITFDHTNWGTAVEMTVAAVDDGVVENTMLSAIVHTANNGYGDTTMEFEVVDNDSASV